jgi:hypothetical protein
VGQNTHDVVVAFTVDKRGFAPPPFLGLGHDREVRLERHRGRAEVSFQGEPGTVTEDAVHAWPAWTPQWDASPRCSSGEKPSGLALTNRGTDPDGS